jgi:hypothetical protein
MNRSVLAALLQVLGIVLIAFAGWIVTPALGIALAGAGALLFGIAEERET